MPPVHRAAGVRALDPSPIGGEIEGFGANLAPRPGLAPRTIGWSTLASSTPPNTSPLHPAILSAEQPIPPALPSDVGLGASTIHRYLDPRVVASQITVTAFVPIPSAGATGVMLDLNKKALHETIPDRAVIGDAGRTRAFLGIDKRPGTALHQAIGEIVDQIPKNAGGGLDPEQVIQFVRVQINQLLAWPPGSSANDGAAVLPWDLGIQTGAQVWDAFAAAGALAVGHDPVPAGEDHPVVPLEKYLALGKRYCIHKAILAALILERCAIPHRVVNGAVSTGPGTTTGHTWIELADGRILDPAWKLVAAPKSDGAPIPGFFQLGGWWRFENQSFPYLRLE
jgi:hypothetical protein